MSGNVSRYLSAVGEATEEYDSELLANLLKLDDRVVPGGWDFVDYLKSRSPLDIQKWCRNKVRPPFDKIVENHLQCIHHASKKEHIQAMSLQKKKFEMFLEVYKSEGSWLTQVMYTLILDTRKLAMLADRDEQSRGGKGDNEHLVDAKRLFDSCFRFTIMGRATTEDGVKKRAGALFIVINQFKVYFKLGTLQLCKNLIRSVNQPNFPKFESFPVSHRVTYKFYVGRIKVLEDDMAEADKHLTYALEHCHKEYHGNIRRILEYLIPVKLILGYLPDEELLKRQELSHLSGLVKCVKIGDVRKLSEELERNQHLYISKGLYLSLDRLKVIAYRNLIRAVVSIHQENVKADATQKATNAQRVPLRMLVNPFKRYGDSDLLELAEDKKDDSGVSIQIMDQIKCILSNLIFKGYVKGYISHEKSFLVLSANQPFPPVKNGRLF